MAGLSDIRGISELRQEIGLTQEELSGLAGISQVYLSLIERGKKPLSQEAAVKLTAAINKFRTYKEDRPLNATSVRANHIAKFYDKEVQELVSNLVHEITLREIILNKVIESGKVPSFKVGPAENISPALAKLIKVSDDELKRDDYDCSMDELVNEYEKTGKWEEIIEKREKQLKNNK